MGKNKIANEAKKEHYAKRVMRPKIHVFHGPY